MKAYKEIQVQGLRQALRPGRQGRRRLRRLSWRRLLPVLWLAAALWLTAACGGPSPQDTPLALDVEDLGERLYTELEYRDQLEELKPAVMYTMLGIDAADVAAQKNYFSSVATSEEIIVLEAADEAAVGRLKTALEARLKAQQELYAAYSPEEVVYLRGAVLESREKYLIFCVAADGEAAAELVREALDGG